MSAAKEALSDMKDEIQRLKRILSERGFENPAIWIVGVDRLYTKEQRRLNRELGVSAVNYKYRYQRKDYGQEDIKKTQGQRN